MNKHPSKVKSEDVDWEKEYKSTKKELWEQKPHTFSNHVAKYVKEGKVLDVGSGEGYDCLYFAKKGHDVTAIDISQTAIDKLLDEAKKYKLKIKGIVGDINKIKIEDKYNIIVSYGVLQFLGKKFKSYLADLKEKTLHGGIHAFYVFGDKGDFYTLAKHRFYFPSESELKNIYSDWNILKFEKKNTKLLIKGDNDKDLYNLMFKLLVQKNN